MIDATKYGPWAVIPGGSESLGASFANILAAAGINIVIISRKQGPLDAVAADLRARHGVEVRTLSLDLARDDMLDRVREVTDDIDVGLVVYNAGAAHWTGPFLDGTLDDALRTVRTNALGYVQFAHHFGKLMAERGRGGGYVSIGSMAAVAGTPGVISYTASKVFGQFLAEGLWMEWKQYGIDVLHVMLGAVNSPAMARIGIVYGPDQMPVDPDEEAQTILDCMINDGGPVYVPAHLQEEFDESHRLTRRGAVEAVWDRLNGVTGVTHREDAGRREMMKQVVLLKRNPKMSMAEFIDYYENHHSKIGERALTTAKRYVRRYVHPEINPVTGVAEELDFDVVMELWWETRADFETAMSSITGDLLAEMYADEEIIFNSHNHRSFTVEEYETDMDAARAAANA